MSTIALQSSISSNARSLTGFPYFWPVDRGRRGFRAQPGKVLRFVANGQVLFRRSVGPSRPRNITGQALASLGQSAQAAALSATGQTLNSWMASFLNNLADLEAGALQRATPNVTGQLARSYVVQKAQ